ncbi:MAG TPA: FGGY-family carbohydrate kinase [Planctomycetota bacterium]|nr:FGGY-family carbohydrate kinase [Planctomycetota bacterium]
MADARAVAAIDCGTTRIKLAVFVAGERPSFVALADAANVVETGEGGAARCRWSAIWRAVEGLLERLGAWCAAQGVRELDLGLSGQVSSLLRWDAVRDDAVDEAFPIWMDSTCRDALPAAQRLLGDGGATRLLGTALPPMTSWLAVKLMHARAQGGIGAVHALQVADAVFRRLTGRSVSHPTAQISLVDQVSGAYAGPVLEACGVDAQRLPRLDARGGYDLRDECRHRFALPATRVFAGLQDTNATMLGLSPEDGDGLWLTGTSEILGVHERTARAIAPERLVRARLGKGWAIYGSSLSGGATLAWLMEEVLRDPARLPALTAAAARIAPGADGLICLPYLAGERAPLWEPRWSGALIGLRAHHGDAHLLRAVLEGVALARRQVADALGCALPRRFLIAGGGAANALWNRIRAAVMDRPLAHDAANDLALVGVVRHVLACTGRDDAALGACLPARAPIAPDAYLVRAYAELAPRFAAAQRALAPDGAWLP